MDELQQRKNRRGGGGRAARHQVRTQPKPSFNPAAPGQRGGQYKPLSDEACQRLIDEAFRILAEIGLSEVPPVLADQAISQGAHWDSRGRLCFPRELVQSQLDGAAKAVTYYGREAQYDVTLGGDRVFFGTGGAAVQTLDMGTEGYRPSTLRDLYDFTRLIDTLDNVSYFTRCCVATDLPDNFDLDTNTVYALLQGTKKPVGTSFTVVEHVDPIVDMLEDVARNEGFLWRDRPFVYAHISPVISPLRFGDDAVQVALKCIERGVPMNNIIAAQSGATAPATPAGFLAMSTAETIASLMMVNLFEPGFPMVFSNWPLVIDLRTGAFAGGGGEVALMNAAAAQISNALGLPSGVASSMSDSKAVDAQMGMEKGITALAAGLAGANSVYESSGMMASLLGASFEAFVADNEMLGHVHRVLRGIEITEATLGFDTIIEAVTGEGHFLGTDQTMASMERDYYYPPMADREQPNTWEEQGKLTHQQRCKAKAQRVLDEHQPTYLSPEMAAAFKERFNIQLDV